MPAKTKDKDRPDQSLADFVGIALAPALVMCLVGTLVLFLLEVCYSGDYVERMRWTMFFFVFGIVLVCRMAMLPDVADRTWLYGGFLAAGTWVCLQTFVEYPHDSLIRALSPLINLLLIAIVWWSSGKLVRDCTSVDEDADMSGEGLLQASGIEKVGKDATGKDAEDEKTTAQGLIAWWERYQRYRQKQEKKRTLGVWVIYFSLAALPLFGLGQSIIPPADGARRQASFLFLMGYVASGLCLLMTTCFLGLRRYLRQRKLKMPPAMTGVWLTCGLILIAALLGAGAVLPRPNSEYALFDLKSLTGGELFASSHAPLSDSPAKGPGEGGNSPDKEGKEGEANGNSGQKEKGAGSGEGNNSGGQQGEKSGDGQKGGNEQGKQQGGEKSGNQQGGERAGKQPGENKGGNQSGSRSGNPGRTGNQRPGKGGQSQDSKSGSRDGRPSSSSVTEGTANIVKWIVFAIVGLITVGVVLFALVRFLANFTPWAANLLKAWQLFWARLFGRRAREADDDQPAVARVKARPPRPFSSYNNPFRLGQPWTPYELCCYTFVAFEAWAREHGVARQPGETPLEHAERLAEEIPDMQTDARRLALIYARGLYGSDELPPAVNDVLQQVWEHMETGARQPVGV
jgi:hypothetical protein